VKTPMFHWGQGTMFKALAHLLSKVNGERHAPAPREFKSDLERKLPRYRLAHNLNDPVKK